MGRPPTYEISAEQAFADRLARRLVLVTDMTVFWGDDQADWRTPLIKDVMLWASNRSETGELAGKVVVADPRFASAEYMHSGFYTAWDNFLRNRGFDGVGFAITFESTDRKTYLYPRNVVNPAITIPFYGKEFFRRQTLDDAWMGILGEACDGFEFDEWWTVGRHELELADRLRRGHVTRDRHMCSTAITQIILIGSKSAIRCFSVPVVDHYQ